MNANLANRLTSLGYVRLFEQPDETALESIWHEASAPESLVALTYDPDTPALARFLAAEILFRMNGLPPSAESKKQLAAIYATALAQNLTETANPWGLPDALDGPVGEHLLELGDNAVPQLMDLLNDDRPVSYAGSQEATLGHFYGFRVKDLAAAYIGKIRNIPFTVDQDPRARDKEIDKLRTVVR
jgi:hypothetical protein